MRKLLVLLSLLAITSKAAVVVPGGGGGGGGSSIHLRAGTNITISTSGSTNTINTTALTSGAGITLTTNGGLITITATGTNSASVTNVFLRPGFGVSITTNAPTDWTVSYSLVFTNSKTVWVDPNGNDTTSIRGVRERPSATITNAIALAQAGDTIRIMAGTYVISNYVNVPTNGMIVGDGNVIVQNYANSGTTTLLPAFRLADNSLVKNITVTNMLPTLYQACFGSSSAGLQASFTNAVVESCIGYGDSDCWYISHSNACSVKVIDPIFNSHWDAAVSGNGAHNVEWYGGKLSCTWPSQQSDAAGVSHAFIGTSGTNKFFGTYFYVLDAPTNAFGVTATGTGCQVELAACRIFTSSTNGTIRDISQAVSAVVASYASMFDVTKVFGTVQYFPQIHVANQYRAPANSILEFSTDNSFTRKTNTMYKNGDFRVVGSITNDALSPSQLVMTDGSTPPALISGGTTASNIIRSIQWWTNNQAGFLYPSFQSVLDTSGATPGPSIVIRTNDGSVFIGKNVNQDINMSTATPQIYHLSMVDSNENRSILWQGNVIDSENYGFFSDFRLEGYGNSVSGAGGAKAQLQLEAFPTNFTEGRKIILHADLTDGTSTHAIDVISNSTAIFQVNAYDGNLSLVRNVGYQWPFTNASADQVLASSASGQLYWTNQNASGGGGSIGPGTVNYWAKFTSTTNVGDSVVRQANTNLVEYRMNPSGGTAFTNNFTNTFYTEYSSEATNEGLHIIASQSSGINPFGSRQHEIKGFQNGSTNGIVPLNLMGSLYVEPSSSPITGHAAGFVYPVSDNTQDFGSSSSRWASMRTGIRGYTADVYTNAGNLTFSAGGTGFGVAADRIDVWTSSGGGKMMTLATNLGGGSKILFGPSGGLAIGAVFGTPDTFLTHNSLDAANTWQMGTNHNSATTRGPSTYIHGSASDDNAANRAGGNAYFVGGPASGNGTNGSVAIATYNKGSSGFGYNTVVPRVFAGAVPVTLTTNSATLFLNITLPTALKSMGGVVHAHTEIGDGTDVAAKDEDFAWTAIRKSTTVTTSISASANSSTVASGSLAIGSTTFTAVANAQTVDLKCNLVTTGGLATTANIMYTISFNSTAASAFVEQ